MSVTRRRRGHPLGGVDTPDEPPPPSGDVWHLNDGTTAWLLNDGVTELELDA